MTTFRKKPLNLSLMVLLTVILLISLVLLGKLFFWWIQPRYVFYDGERQQWEEIQLTFPSARMGSDISFIVAWDPLHGAAKFIEENFDGDYAKFYDEFNRSIRILQWRNGEEKQIPIIPEGSGADFGSITVPDQAYDDETLILIRMDEPLKSRTVPGRIMLWKSMK